MTTSMQLNEKIQTWLKSQGRVAGPGDYETQQPDGQPDQITVWNSVNLGPQPTADQLAAVIIPDHQLIAQAQAALDQSDITILRCAENQVAVPAEWATYRKSLRAILASGTGTIPPQPPYPAGT